MVSQNDDQDRTKLMVIHMESFKKQIELIRNYLNKTKQISVGDDTKEAKEMLTKIEDVKLLTAILNEYYAWNLLLNEQRAK
jgi:CRISPR/Cas system CMR-associated protein Cmr5 small subunit